MRRRFGKRACFCVSIAMSGCYSLSSYPGEGSISEGQSPETRYEIAFPPCGNGMTEYTVAGAPDAIFTPMLILPEAWKIPPVEVWVELRDESDRVLSRRGGVLSDQWIRRSLSEPGVHLVPGHSADADLISNAKYRYRLYVTDKEDGLVLTPVLWSGRRSYGP